MLFLRWTVAWLGKRLVIPAMTNLDKLCNMRDLSLMQAIVYSTLCHQIRRHNPPSVFHEDDMLFRYMIGNEAPGCTTRKMCMIGEWFTHNEKFGLGA